jgi:DtxR family Mn-dependent transcriptional regulator
MITQREHALEAFYMAAQQDDFTIDGARRIHPDAVTPEELDVLDRDGLVSRDGATVRLTAAGEALAADVVRRHRLTEVLLSTVLGLGAERASEIGCMVEHDIRPEMVDAVCTLLGHPSCCPHGDPIPAGPCCAARRTTVESQVVPLTTLSAGERGRIVYVRPRSRERLQRLTSLGLTPGVIVTLHRRQPAFCLRFEETELAIDRDVADDIQVSRILNGPSSCADDGR